MRAVVFEGVGRPLEVVERPLPEPAPGQLRLRVEACGICRTDLHLLDGEVTVREPPRVLGHQIVGGRRDRAGASACPWLGWTCGECAFCRVRAREPLRPRAVHRLRHRRRDGRVHRRRRALLLPGPRGLPGGPGGAAAVRGADRLPRAADVQATPRASASTASARRRTSSRRWRARRAGASSRSSAPATRRPEPSRCAWAPSGRATLATAARTAGRGDHLRPRGRARPGRARRARAGRHAGARRHPHERHPVVPVRAAVARAHDPLRRQPDSRTTAREFLALAPRVPVRTEVTTYPLEAASRALDDLRAGRFSGAAVVVP